MLRRKQKKRADSEVRQGPFLAILMLRVFSVASSRVPSWFCEHELCKVSVCLLKERQKGRDKIYQFTENTSEIISIAAKWAIIF